MKGRNVLFSHKNDEWETPKALFDELNKEFHFDLDIAANETNSKCNTYIHDIDAIDDGRDPYFKDTFNFTYYSIWCNPSYSNQRKFIEFVIKHRLNSVFLLPARTDTKLFHELIYPFQTSELERGFHDYEEDMYFTEIRFIKGRLKFGNSKNSAPFPSMIVIFRFD